MGRGRGAVRETDLNLPGQRSCPWEREVAGQSGLVSLEKWDLLSKTTGNMMRSLRTGAHSGKKNETA